MNKRTPGDRVPGAQWSGPLPGAQWFAGHDAVGQPGLVMQDDPTVQLGVKTDELHRELPLAQMRYEMLRGFTQWVSDQRKVEGMTIEAICDAADRALRGDKSIEVADDDSRAAG
jgi:hypothetical protein